MAGRKYKIEFAASAWRQLSALRASERVLLLESIETQLTFEPSKETRRRKPLRPNPLAPWELQVGRFRVFYDVGVAEPPVVSVLAIGTKRGNRLLIESQEFNL